MSLEGRYLDRAQRIAEEFINTEDKLTSRHRAELADRIVLLLREYVHHDMEWAALAVEAMRDSGDERYGRSEFDALAASFRKRGCEP